MLKFFKELLVPSKALVSRSSQEENNMGFPWIPMGSYGFAWILMDSLHISLFFYIFLAVLSWIWRWCVLFVMYTTHLLQQDFTSVGEIASQSSTTQERQLVDRPEKTNQIQASWQIENILSFRFLFSSPQDVVEEVIQPTTERCPIRLIRQNDYVRQVMSCQAFPSYAKQLRPDWPSQRNERTQHLEEIKPDTWKWSRHLLNLRGTAHPFGVTVEILSVTGIRVNTRCWYHKEWIGEHFFSGSFSWFMRGRGHP